MSSSEAQTMCKNNSFLLSDKAVDFWALGILIYEMLGETKVFCLNTLIFSNNFLVGRPPFYAKDAYAIYEKILLGKIEWFKNFDAVAKDLM